MEESKSFKIAKKTVDIAYQIAPLLSGLTEKEFLDVVEILTRAVKEQKDPIQIDFMPYVSIIHERFNRE